VEQTEITCHCREPNIDSPVVQPVAESLSIHPSYVHLYAEIHLPNRNDSIVIAMKRNAKYRLSVAIKLFNVKN
jgi:hypothetical protein